MKKTIVSTIIVFFAASVFSQTMDPNLKFFRGIRSDFMGTQSQYVPMEQQVQYVNSVIGNPGQPVNIVGHSQGGLRALGYAGLLNQTGRAGNIKNIVSIGGPVRGFSPLAKGAAVLKDDIDKAANKISGGLQAVDKLGVDIDGLSKIRANGGLAGLLTAFSVDGTLFTELVQNADNSSMSFRDMKPGSAFIQKNVVSNTIEYRNVETVVPSLFKKKRIITVRIPTSVTKYALPANVSYGFIVGNNSDVLEMAEDYGATGYYIGNTRWQIPPTSMDGYYCLATSIAAQLWKAKEVLAHADYLRYKAGLFYPGHAKDALKKEKDAAAWEKKANAGYDWVYHYEKNIATILGTGVNGNDSFIPCGDQYIDVAAFGGRYIDRETKGKFEGKYNHLTETNHTDIWGSGGGLDINTIGYNGKLASWIYPGTLTSGTVKGANVK